MHTVEDSNKNLNEPLSTPVKNVDGAYPALGCTSVLDKFDNWPILNLEQSLNKNNDILFIDSMEINCEPGVGFCGDANNSTGNDGRNLFADSNGIENSGNPSLHAAADTSLQIAKHSDEEDLTGVELSEGWPVDYHHLQVRHIEKMIICCCCYKWGYDAGMDSVKYTARCINDENVELYRGYSMEAIEHLASKAFKELPKHPLLAGFFASFTKVRLALDREVEVRKREAWKETVAVRTISQAFVAKVNSDQSYIQSPEGRYEAECLNCRRENLAKAEVRFFDALGFPMAILRDSATGLPTSVQRTALFAGNLGKSVPVPTTDKTMDACKSTILAEMIDSARNDVIMENHQSSVNVEEVEDENIEDNENEDYKEDDLEENEDGGEEDDDDEARDRERPMPGAKQQMVKRASQAEPNATSSPQPKARKAVVVTKKDGSMKPLRAMKLCCKECKLSMESIIEEAGHPTPKDPKSYMAEHRKTHWKCKICRSSFSSKQAFDNHPETPKHKKNLEKLEEKKNTRKT